MRTHLSSQSLVSCGLFNGLNSVSQSWMIDIGQLKLLIKLKSIKTDIMIIQWIVIHCCRKNERSEPDLENYYLQVSSIKIIKHWLKIFSWYCKINNILLSRSASESLKRYKTNVQEDKEKLKQIKSLNSRQQYSLHLCYGQKMLLNKLINACNWKRCLNYYFYLSFWTTLYYRQSL